MAAVPLFWNTNMAAVTSCENALFLILNCWAQLIKMWIALSTGKITIQWILQLVFVILIHWIAIYPVDSG